VRYAVYFAPLAASALWRFGCAWLGRDPERGADMARPACAIEEKRIAATTRDAARYGWHATLKPPFTLAAGRNEADLVAAVERFAAARERFTGPVLQVGELDGFLALLPAAPCPPLDSLAADAVRTLDLLRAPASPADLARRRERGLSARQEHHLAKWGYPDVLEDFQFHLTLTDRLAPEDVAAFRAALTALTAPLVAAPLPIGEIALFVEDSAGVPFRLLRRFSFGGAAGKKEGEGYGAT
jgi:putative phosphonate metabolism protein